MSVEIDHHSAKGSRAGFWLTLWMIAVVLLQGAVWVTGMRPYTLAVGVERGAAKVEAQQIGEVGEDVVRRAIQLQRDTLPFWTTLTLLADFVAEPLFLAARALAVATLLSGLAALTGRPVRFAEALGGSALLQGIWVLGLAVRVGLMVKLSRPEVETSPTLLLPPGTYSAPVWLALRQLDAFALAGWLALAWSGWRRGQASLLAALFVCGGLWLVESAIRVAAGLILGAGMRLTLIPEAAGS